MADELRSGTIPLAMSPWRVAALATTGYTLNTTTAPSPLTGLWWQPDESGWGLSLTQQGPIIFVAWYTYNQSGAPDWYVMSNCAITGNTCTGDIYHVTGGSSPGVPWNGTGKVTSIVGSGSLAFSDDNTGVFSYTLNGASGSKNIVRQMFGSGLTPPVKDYSALWWNPDESGWGVALSQQYRTIFATWYAYDATGKAIWYVASNCAVTDFGNGCAGDLYQVTGGTPPTVTWNGANKSLAKVGNIEFTFVGNASDTTGVMSYTLNGTSVRKSIGQQIFYTFPATTPPPPPPDLTPPLSVVGPSVTATTSSATTLLVAIDENGVGYYRVQPAAAAAPSSATMLAETAFAMTAYATVSLPITGLTAATAYNIYFVAKDTAGNIQFTVGSVAVTTSAAPNHAPTANNFTYGTAIAGAAKTFNWKTLSGASDADGDSLSASTVTDGTKGSCGVAGDNATYTPTTNKSGGDTCTLRISDGNGGTKDIVVTVTGIDTQVPVAPAAPSVTANNTTNLIVLGQGVDGSTLEVSVDGAAYGAYNAATAYAGNHTVKVRTKAVNGNPAGADTTLSFTEVAPTAPSVTADDTSDVIVLGQGVDGANLEVSKDGGAYTAYNAATTYSGDHTVKVRTKAMNGNPAGADTTLSFTTPPPVDSTPPVTTANLSNNSVYNSNQTLTLGSNEAGTTYYRYRVNGGAWSNGGVFQAGTNVSLSANSGEEKTYDVEYYSKDSALNQEGTKIVTVKIDKLAPTLSSQSGYLNGWVDGSAGNVGKVFGALGYPDTRSGTLTFTSPVTIVSAAATGGGLAVATGGSGTASITVTATMGAAADDVIVLVVQDAAGNQTTISQIARQF